ncbi:hypothetical protein EJP617_C080 (plasmid) [Erwinia sp. Ejp617]|nr:hypothetical protein EJP617_C080 [Erwinia sp. Ejp617]
MRSARVLTRKPIIGSSSARSRPATGVPITRSSQPARRPSTTDQAASTVI